MLGSLVAVAHAARVRPVEPLRALSCPRMGAAAAAATTTGAACYAARGARLDPITCAPVPPRKARTAAGSEVPWEAPSAPTRAIWRSPTPDCGQPPSLTCHGPPGHLATWPRHLGQPARHGVPSWTNRAAA